MKALFLSCHDVQQIPNGIFYVQLIANIVIAISLLKVTLQTRAPKNFFLRQWGAERRVKRAQTRERGPPSASAEISF